jgi:hypothetical protein
LLPDTYQDTRNRYAEALYGLGVRVFNLGAHLEGNDMVSAAAYLRIDHSLAERIESTRKQIRGMMALHRFRASQSQAGTGTATASAGKGGNEAFTAIALILIGLFAVIYLANTGGGKGTSRGYYRPNFTYTAPDLPDFSALIKQTEALKEMSEVFGKGRDKMFTALNSYPSDSLQKEAVAQHKGQRLLTGAQPYLNILSPETDSSDKISYVKVINISKTDMVVFLENNILHHNIGHAYIREGENYTFRQVPYGYYELVVYRGRHWVPEALPFQGEMIGAFGEQTQPIPLKRGFEISGSRFSAGRLGDADSSAFFISPTLTVSSTGVTSDIEYEQKKDHP